VNESRQALPGKSQAVPRQGKPRRGASADWAFHKFIIDSLPVAVLTLDASLRITAFNPWAERITGYAAADALGRHCWEVLQSEMCDSHCPLKAVMHQVKATVSGQTSIRNQGGTVVPVQFSAAALFDAEGQLLGGVEAFADISQLVAMEREKANLISMLAHDMRSSLTGIHGLGLRLLRKPADIDPAKERKHLEIIAREAAKLEALIDDFLEFSRIEAGRMKLNLTSTSLDKELEDIFETYQANAAQHGMSIELQVEDILPLIEADANRLRRVFTNLLDNAIKFSGAGGKVTITARETDHEVMVTVADEGVGIDQEDLPCIFDAFHRGKSSGRKTGHGLGLATVKAIVEGHGGRVVVSSQVDKGSAFTVFLPKKHLGAAENTDIAFVSP
jgi:PAS domain S-box-containing protein